MQLSPLNEKWKAFGWETYDVNGHDVYGQSNLFKKIPESKDKLVVVIANTIKGKGVSFMENDNNWHYRIPTEDELNEARSEIYREKLSNLVLLPCG